MRAVILSERSELGIYSPCSAAGYAALKLDPPAAARPEDDNDA